MGPLFHLSIDAKGIATLLFDYPGEKVNKLSVQALEELDRIISELGQNPKVKALVVRSGKEGVFIAGADVKSFGKMFRKPELVQQTISMGHQVFNKLEQLPFPSIAVIEGVCLGGGLELALACTYRVVSDHPKTSLGLPETTLGIFPGFGGTQRLPRLVGFSQGMMMILTGAPVDAKKSYKIKLADAVYSSAFLEEGLSRFIASCLDAKGKKQILARRANTGLYTWIFDKNPLGRAIVSWQAKRGVIKKTKGVYPAPLAAIKLIQSSYGASLKSGLKMEEKAFIKCAHKGDFRYVNALLHIFFQSEALKKETGVSDQTVVPKKIQTAAVLGAGTMGNGIAWLLSNQGIPVRLKDVNQQAIAKGLQAVMETNKTLIRIGKLNREQANNRFHKIATTTGLEGFNHADLVIEAAIENLSSKHAIFREVEEKISPTCLVATNTSSYTLQELSTCLKYPERFVGMHFFNPPSRMPLVEVVVGKHTSAQAVSTAVQFCKELKKTVVIVKDCPGFLVNRIFIRAFAEIMRMFEAGIPMESLEAALLKFGMPMAPFVLADEVGNDVNLKVFQSLSKAYPERICVPKILVAMQEKGWLGKKTGKGFYIHTKKGRQINPGVQEMLGTVLQRETLSEEEVTERVVLAMIHEASLCLEEGIVEKPGYLDMALVFGIGFPPFRGGILYHADTLGIKNVVDRLEKWETLHGKRYAPTQQLLEMRHRGTSFFHASE